MLKIQSAADLLPGDIGFTTIGGRVGAGVALGQALLRDECWFTHAFLVYDSWPNEDSAIAIEAMPRGARSVPLKGTRRIGEGFGYVRLPLTTVERAVMRTRAMELIGTPYSFLDYLSLALLHLGLPRTLTARRVQDSGHMICSQLVDQVLTDVGYHLFEDGRLPQDVTPGALFRQAGAQGDVIWW
jgi:hypothetical protein